MKTSRGAKSNAMLFLALGALLLAAASVSLMLGRYPISATDFCKAIGYNWFGFGTAANAQVNTVLFSVRGPRVIAAILVGAGLSAAGVAYQGLFQNPMVSPDVLGVSAGSGFGAALAILLSAGYAAISVSAFGFGLAAVALAYQISVRTKYNPTLGMVLAGIMIGSLCSAATSFLKLVADPTSALPAITYWLMGSLASVRQRDVLFVLAPILLGLATLYLLRWKLNVMTLGEEEARTLGIHTGRVRFIIVLAATCITAACVSISGMIGWVGLVIPHFARMLFGQDHRRLLPASMLLGATYLVVVDDFARMITTSEIPIGILTAFLGAPFFLYLILKKGGAA